MYSGIEEVIGGLERRELQACRHGLLELIIKVVDRSIDLSSIGARRLIDHECHTGLSIHAGGETIVQGAQLHICYVAQMEHIAMIRTEDD